MIQPHINADITIVHENGSGTITDFVHLEEEYTDNGTRDLHVWYDEHTGDPDDVYQSANIVSITTPDESQCVEDFNPKSPVPCPYCDGTELSILEIEENIYSVGHDGSMTYTERGYVSGPRINVYCCDCHSYLYRSGIDHLIDIE